MSIIVKMLYGWSLSAVIVCAVLQAEIKNINPVGEPFPLEVYKVPIGTIMSIEFDMKPPAADEVMYLFLEIADLDRIYEMQVALNNNVLTVPKSIVNDVDSAFAYLPISPAIIKDGRNILSFAFMDNLNNTTLGFFVHNAQFWVAKEADRKALRDKLDEMSVLDVELINEDKEQLFEYFEDFNVHQTAQASPYWMPVRGSAVVAGDEDEKFLRLDGLQQASISTVHLFSSATVFSAKIRADRAPAEGGLWLGIRYNLENAYVVKCGYDFEKRQWIIKDYFKHYLWEHSPVESDFQTAKWYEVKIEAVRNSVDFYVDGKLLCRSRTVRNVNYGKIMLEADGVIADFDDIRYTGTGKPQAGVSSYHIHGFGNGDMIRLNNGDLVMQYCGQNRFLRSSDNGFSWKPDTIFTSATSGWGLCGNIWHLQSGKILHIYQKLISPHPNFKLQARAEISEDDGKNWKQGGWLHKEPGPYCTMNGKITQATNGRIFFPAATGGEGLDGEEHGGVGVWYSDDDGQSWTESAIRLDMNTTGLNLQEGEVVELSGGNLALVMRSDTGYLMYSLSTDNGVSWSKDIKSTNLPSTMCAFNTFRDNKTGEIFVFWTYEDPNSKHELPQFPRERVSLARSTTDFQSWEFLTDIEDFKGNNGRYMNLGMFVDDDCVYTMVNVFGTRIGKDRAAMLVTRIERNKLNPYESFPPLH
jgi:hypothetical protein